MRRDAAVGDRLLSGACFAAGAALVALAFVAGLLGLEKQPGFGGNQILALLLGVLLLLAGSVLRWSGLSRNPDFWSAWSLTAMTAYFMIRIIDLSAPPFEDASMLMRYAENFRNGYGFVFNSEGPPVDGATDLLAVPLIAFLDLVTGAGIPAATRLLAFGSHFVSVALVYAAMRRFGAPWYAALLVAVYYNASFGMWGAAAYFVTPLFALAVIGMWLAARRWFDGGPSYTAAAGFVALAALAALIRPEGLAMAWLLLVSLVALRPGGGMRKDVFVADLGLAMVTAALFVGRTAYFGHPMPNPYYVRRVAGFDWEGFRTAVGHLWRWAWPFLPLYLAAPCSPDGFRRAGFALAPLIGFTLLWGLVSNEMNFGGRYEYPALAPALLGAWWVGGGVVTEAMKQWLHTGPGVRARALTATAYGIALIGHSLVAGSAPRNSDGAWIMGRVLRAHFGERNWTMAVTEAGTLAYYSGWRAIDCLGLNDKHVAHHGLSEEYLDRYRPELIHLASRHIQEDIRSWVEHKPDPREGAVEQLFRYAAKRGYETAAIFTSEPSNAYWYLVRPDIARTTRLVELIRSVTYFDRNTDRVAPNVAGTVREVLFRSEAPGNARGSPPRGRDR